MRRQTSHPQAVLSKGMISPCLGAGGVGVPIQEFPCLAPVPWGKALFLLSPSTSSSTVILRRITTP